MRRIIIPYNPALKKLARELRKNMTFSEIVLWNELKNGQMLRYDFDRQHPIGNYIVDFYCKDLLLALEVDGITHEDDHVAAKDIIRQQELEECGVQFLRFNALGVVHDMQNVLRTIENWIIEYEEKNGVLEHIVEKRKKK